MGTSPTSQSAPLSNAAKDDVLGANGTFTFSIKDLLANDAGAAAKINIDTQFFFGSGLDQNDQETYMLSHGITKNPDGTYTVSGGDFEYSVQIGNKGTWSTAHVDVAAHAGETLFTENFDGYVNNADNPLFGVVNLTGSGWTGGSSTELGADGYGGIQSTSGDDTSAYWLDTQNSPGPISISHEFVDPTGGKAQLSFDIGIQSLEFNGQHYETDSDAKFQFKVDGNVVAEFTHDQLVDLAGENNLAHFEVLIDTGAAGSSHTLELVDVSAAGYTGFAIDSIKINDWVI